MEHTKHTRRRFLHRATALTAALGSLSIISPAQQENSCGSGGGDGGNGEDCYYGLDYEYFSDGDTGAPPGYYPCATYPE